MHQPILHLVFVMGVAACLGGCAATPISYEVRDDAGRLIVRQTISDGDARNVLNEIDQSISLGDFERCRAVALLASAAWPGQVEVQTQARRKAAWCQLFMYQGSRPSMTALENEAQNVRLLAEALRQFRRLPRSWSNEALVITRALNSRQQNLEAFDATVAALRSAAAVGSAEAWNGAIGETARRYPSWAGSIRMDELIWRSQAGGAGS